jgi:hypothetical protein
MKNISYIILFSLLNILVLGLSHHHELNSFSKSSLVNIDDNIDCNLCKLFKNKETLSIDFIKTNALIPNNLVDSNITRSISIKSSLIYFSLRAPPLFPLL